MSGPLRTWTSEAPRAASRVNTRRPLQGAWYSHRVHFQTRGSTLEEWQRGMSFACLVGLDSRLRESGRRSSTYPHKHRGSPPQRFSIGAAVPPLWVERARVAREFCTGGGCYLRPNRGSGTRRSLGRLGSCIIAPPLTGGLWGLALFLRGCGKKVIVGEEDAGHVAQQLLLPMFLSEPGGVSGRRRIGIHATRFPETPPETFGGFFVDMFPGSKGHRVFPRGPFL